MVPSVRHRAKGLKDLSSGLLVHGGHLKKLFQCGFFDSFNAAKSTQQGSLARPADARNTVQSGKKCLPGSKLLVMSDGKTMRLVSHSLQQEKRVGVALQDNRIALSREEDPLF